jgi:hypothetical protein
MTRLFDLFDSHDRHLSFPVDTIHIIMDTCFWLPNKSNAVSLRICDLRRKTFETDGAKMAQS